MALNPNPLQRERVLVQAADTGDRFRAPDTNAALQLAQSLRQIAPEVGEHLDQVAARESEKQKAQAKKDALVGQGQKLADAVRAGKLKPTQNPWYMEAYAKESSAIRAQGSFTQLQLDSTTWAERNDPAAFQKRWAEEVGKLSEGFAGPDEIAGFSPIEHQFTQQTLQSNTAENVQRIISEREQNVSSLAAQALAGAASRSGGTLSAAEAVAALEPSKQMWLHTGGTEAKWHDLTVKAITSAAYSSQNAGLLDLTKAIGLNGAPVLEGKFGNGPDASERDHDPYSEFPLVTNPDKSTWDKRADGSEKGMGWLGLRKRPDGTVSSEISVGVELGRKEREIPLMVPGLTGSELRYLMTHSPEDPGFLKELPAGLMDKAVAFAKERVGQGKSPFRQADEAPAPSPSGPSRLATAALPAKHAMPVQGGRITGRFGEKRSYETHNALDIAIPVGTPVVSPGVGTVEAVDTAGKGPSGKLVRVDHGDGVISAYGHLSQINVKPGDKIAAGQLLALSGNTGRSTGAHLHWAVKVRGQAVNPQSVAFPQGAKPGGVEQMGGAVAALAAQELNPAAPAPEGPQGQIAQGPSLYDIAGTADSLESDRYRINQAQEDAITSKVRAQKAKLAARGQEATTYLYAQHGTSILLGDYKVPELVSELTAQGFKAQEIGEALGNLRNATGDSAGLSANRMAINGSEPQKAKAVMDLALEGERDGYSPGYEQRVGEAVLAGTITGDDGTRMVSSARSRTRQQASEDRAEERANRAELAANPNTVKSYTALKQQTTALVSLGAQVHRQALQRPMSDYDRKRLQKYLSDTSGSWLAAHPGDFTGALAQAREFVAGYGRRLQAQGPGWSVRGASPSATPSNPRGGE